MSIDSATSESFQSSTNGPDFEDFDSRPPSDPISSYLPPFPQTPRPIFDPFNSFLSDLPAAPWPPPPPPPPPDPSPRAPKKRARASRRAPTTVLTTDTSNFRAMVQEFTGIPAPPFASTPLFSRPRLDLFDHSAAPAPPSFLLRPFAHKRQAIGLPNSLSGISPNTLHAPPNQPLFSNTAQNPSLAFQTLVQEHHQWPAAAGYGGGELGSVIAGAAPSSEPGEENMKAAAERFSPARGEDGLDASWRISSD